MIGSDTMIGFGNKLSKEYNVAYLDVIPFTNTDIIASASRAAEKIKRIQGDGYSVIPLWWCMWWLTALEAIAISKIRVDNLLAISTPFQWAQSAKKFGWLRHIWFPGVFQTNDRTMLHTRDAQEYIKQLTVLITKNDNIVTPEEQNPDSLKANLIHIDADHIDLLHWETSDKIVEAVKEALAKKRVKNPLS